MTDLATLTPRERQVFDLIIAAKLQKQIAHALGMHSKTVSTHRAKIYDKLGVRTDVELALIHANGALTGVLERAADHALVAAALCAHVARWEPFSGDPTGTSGEVCTGGLRYCTSLDEHGVPILTNLLRNALRVAMPAAVKVAA